MTWYPTEFTVFLHVSIQPLLVDTMQCFGSIHVYAHSTSVVWSSNHYYGVSLCTLTLTGIAMWVDWTVRWWQSIPTTLATLAELCSSPVEDPVRHYLLSISLSLCHHSFCILLSGMAEPLEAYTQPFLHILRRRKGLVTVLSVFLVMLTDSLSFETPSQSAATGISLWDASSHL